MLVMLWPAGPATDRLLAIADRIEPQEAGGGSEPTHSADFTSVNWYGTRYRFSKGNQAETIRVLWAEWERGGHGLGQETVGDKIESQADYFRLAHVFRDRKRGGMHPAWKTMIHDDGKGVFRLVVPKDTE